MTFDRISSNISLPTRLGRYRDHFYLDRFDRLGWVFEHGIVLLDLLGDGREVLHVLRVETPNSRVYDFDYQRPGKGLPAIYFEDQSSLLWDGEAYKMDTWSSHNISTRRCISETLREANGCFKSRGRESYYLSTEEITGPTGSCTRVWQHRFLTTGNETLRLFPTGTVLRSVHPTFASLYAVETPNSFIFCEGGSELASWWPSKRGSWSWTRLGCVLMEPGEPSNGVWQLRPSAPGVEWRMLWSNLRVLRGPIEDFKGRVWASHTTGLVCSRPKHLPEPKFAPGVWQ